MWHTKTVCKFSQSAKLKLTFCHVENPIGSKMAVGEASQVLDEGAGDNGSVPLIRNELLTFVSQKLNYMPTDSIVQLCVQFYDEEAIGADDSEDSEDEFEKNFKFTDGLAEWAGYSQSHIAN